MFVRAMSASALLVALGACRTAIPTDAGAAQRIARSAGPTLLVTNETCRLGVCVPLEVRAFIPQWVVPGQPPAGVPFMGWVDARTVCLRFPPADTFRVIGVNSAGTPIDTALTIWMPDSSVVLMAATSSYQGLGMTTEFVPGASRGWSVTFPDASVQVAPAPAAACTP
jgi:hypothetical protein